MKTLSFLIIPLFLYLPATATENLVTCIPHKSVHRENCRIKLESKIFYKDANLILEITGKYTTPKEPVAFSRSGIIELVGKPNDAMPRSCRMRPNLESWLKADERLDIFIGSPRMDDPPEEAIIGNIFSGQLTMNGKTWSPEPGCSIQTCTLDSEIKKKIKTCDFEFKSKDNEKKNNLPQSSVSKPNGAVH